MRIYSENISPDSLTGSIFAIEGIKDSCTILNGPTGCKFYHSAIADSQFIRSLSFDPKEYSEEFYFGQPRVPTSYLDSEDYIYGSSDKLESIINKISKKDYKFIAIVNSPGAALIGDDLNGILRDNLENIPYCAIENTGYSKSYSQGYENALLEVLKSLDLKKLDLKEKTVNIIGISIYDKYFRNNLKSIKNLLSEYGIRIICSLGAGDGIDQIRKMGEAELNVVVKSEYGKEIAKYLKEKTGRDYLILEEGAPIGFEASENFLRQILSFFSIEKEADKRIEKARAVSYLHLSRFTSLTGLPKGAYYSIKADTSTVYPLMKFLTSYLGMLPVAIDIIQDRDEYFIEKIKKFLVSINRYEAFNRKVLSVDTDILFSDANTISQLKFKGYNFTGIEISLPSFGYIDITYKTLYGPDGALFILEQILNGLRYLKI